MRKSNHLGGAIPSMVECVLTWIREQYIWLSVTLQTNHFVHCSFSTSNKITSKGCQSASKTCDFDAKNAKFFWGGGRPPPQIHPTVGRGTPSPHAPPPRCLDLNPSHSEILPTLLEWRFPTFDATCIPVSRLKGQRSRSPGPLMLTHSSANLPRTAGWYISQ